MNYFYPFETVIKSIEYTIMYRNWIKLVSLEELNYMNNIIYNVNKIVNDPLDIPLYILLKVIVKKFFISNYDLFSQSFYDKDKDNVLDYYFIEEFTHTYFTEVLEKFFGFNIFVFDKFDSELLLPNYKFNYIKNTYYNKSIFLLYNSNKKIYDIIFTKNNEKNKEKFIFNNN